MPTVSFFRRIAAGVVDLLLPGVFFAAAVILLVIGDWRQILPIALGFLVGGKLAAIVNSIVFPALRGQSAGCRFFKIRLIRTDRPQPGQGIGWSAALTRVLVQIGLSPFFLLGYLWHFVDARGRMWHDLLAGTAVIPADAVSLTPFVTPSRARMVLGSVGGFLGVIVSLATALAIVAAPVVLLLVSRLPPGREAGVVLRAELPENFPSTVVIAGKEYITEMAERTLPDGRREVLVRWESLPGEPASVLVAYKTGFELFGYATRIEYADTGPKLHFQDAAGTTSGVMEMLPSEDERTVRLLVLRVAYPRKSP